MSSIKLKPVEQATGGVGEISPLLLPVLRNYFAERAVRLRQLAEGHQQAAYLMFAARVAEAQQVVLASLPVAADEVHALAELLGHGAPLDVRRLPRSAYWQVALVQLIEPLRSEANASVAMALDAITGMSAAQRESCAEHLLEGRYEQVDSGQAVLFWAALTLYFSQLAEVLPATAQALVGEQRQYCPVCTSAPVASVILTGKRAGLRYLHCGLCESRWHMVRVKCSNCEGTGKLDYWSLDQQDSPIKAESCGDCGSYLKVFYPEHDLALEPVADDIASLVLDAGLEAEGFARSSVNPFLFPG